MEELQEALRQQASFMLPFRESCSLQPYRAILQAAKEVEELEEVLGDLVDKVEELQEAARQQAATKRELRAAFSQIASAFTSGAPVGGPLPVGGSAAPPAACAGGAAEAGSSAGAELPALFDGTCVFFQAAGMQRCAGHGLWRWNRLTPHPGC